MSRFSDILSNIKKNLSDDEGWFRQKKFTPLKQINNLTDPQVYSPLSTDQAGRVQASNRGVPYQAPQTPAYQAPVIQPPKPSFKTNIASKLNDRIDKLKRFGTSTATKVFDNEGLVQQGRFTPKKYLDAKSSGGSNFWSSPVAKKLVNVQKKIEDPNMSKDVGEWLRKNADSQANTFDDNNLKPFGVFHRTAGNMGANLAQTVLSGVQQGGTNLAELFAPDKTVGQRASSAIKSGMGLARAVTPATGTFNIANILASLPRRDYTDPDVIRRLASGTLGGQTGEDLATNVPDVKTDLGIFGEADLVKGAGSMYGFTKNPAWKAIFGKTSAISEAKWLANPVTNFLATRGVKGGIEGLVQGLGDMPDDLSPVEKAKFMTSNVLQGMGSEILFDLVEGGVKKGAKRLWSGASETKVYSQAYDYLRDAKGRFTKAVDKVKFPSLKENQIKFIKTYENKYGSEQSPLRSQGKPTEQELTLYKQLMDKLHLDRLKRQSGAIDFGANVGRDRKQSKPESIGDIFAKSKTDIGKPTGFTVKGQNIDADQLLKEGWKPDQVDYAIKLANESDKTIKDVGAYVRGILKSQYPDQASKMGGLSGLLEPSPKDVAESDFNATKTLDDILSATPKVEQPEVKIPKVETTSKVDTKLDEMFKRETSFTKIANDIDALAKKEGLEIDQPTYQGILDGTIKTSTELKTKIDKVSQFLGKEQVRQGFPEEKLMESHISQVDKTKMSLDATKADYGSMLVGHTFSPTSKRSGVIPTEKLASGSESFIQEYRSILKKDYSTEQYAKNLMEEHSIGKENEQKVLDFVKQQQAEFKRIDEEHLTKTKFGDSIDYIENSKKAQIDLEKITGIKTDRPIVEQTQKGLINWMDTGVSYLRGEDSFFKDKTNDEIYNVKKDLRDSSLPDGKNYQTALANFVSTLSKYDYADPAVKDRVNQFIDSKLKENKVIQKTTDKILRATSEVFSMAHIGGKVKTVITQPMETYRVLVEYGLPTYKTAVASSFNPKEASRINKTYGIDNESSNFLAQNPRYKGLMNDKGLASKTYESFKNVLFKGLETTEKWKNTVFAKSAEVEGIKKGLSGDKLKTFVRDELFRLAHMANKDSTPAMVKDSALASSLLQYSQYAMKNFVLKWNTAIAKDTTTANKATKLMSYFLADMASVGTVAMITGIPVKGVRGWFANSTLPSGFGPIVTVPLSWRDDIKNYKEGQEKDPDDNKPLIDRLAKTTFRNIAPMGTQTTLTKGSADVLKKGYSESSKGNINYTAGDLTPIQKTQALLFGKGAIPNKKKADKFWDAKDAGKSDIFPTLTSKQSTILKALPKDEQEVYYNSKIKAQESSKSKLDDILKPKKKLFGKKKVETDAFAIPDKTATSQEVKEFNSLVKEAIDSGNNNVVSDEALGHYFYNKVDKLPESTPSEKQKKTIERFKKLNSIYSSDTLDDETKDRLIKMSGVDEQDVEYYNLAKDDSTVKAMRQEERAGKISREEWLGELEDGRKLVGNEQIVDNATLNQLYERGMLNDAERDYLIAIKYDPATSSYYLDRDYKKKLSGASATTLKKKLADLKKLRALSSKITDITKKSSMATSLDSYLSKKTPASTSKTIGSILSNSITQKNVTPLSKNSGKVKRVKSKYRFN